MFVSNGFLLQVLGSIQNATGLRNPSSWNPNLVYT